jgi:hypothetical protein
MTATTGFIPTSQNVHRFPVGNGCYHTPVVTPETLIKRTSAKSLVPPRKVERTRSDNDLRNAFR